MSLEVIYTVRHGVRCGWDVDYRTGVCTARVPCPTGIAADPPLAARGEAQAKELAAHLAGVVPAVDAIYCSPFYRCLQTIAPFVQQQQQQPRLPLRVEPGIAEFFSKAPYEQPSPAPFSMLQGLFPPATLDASYAPTGIVPGQTGETVQGMHDRVEAALDELIARADAGGYRAILLVSHAATTIGMTRVLTGVGMPEDPFVDDVVAHTAGLSTFRRRREAPAGDVKGGARGQWDCAKSFDCSFLSEGEERGWSFADLIQEADFVDIFAPLDSSKPTTASQAPHL